MTIDGARLCGIDAAKVVVCAGRCAGVDKAP